MREKHHIQSLSLLTNKSSGLTNSNSYNNYIKNNLLLPVIHVILANDIAVIILL